MDKHKLRSRHLKQQFAVWDYKKAIERSSNNETATRDLLIEPFFNILGYDKMNHYMHEFALKISKGRVKKVDMVITINGKKPIMLVECKSAGNPLSEKNFKQLSDYFDLNPSSDIGILTNGVIYKFYCVNWDNERLNNKPFLVFNLNNFTDADLENIVQFDRAVFDINKIKDNANEVYFLDSFEDALFTTLYKPQQELIKLIYNNMGGKKVTADVRKRIYKLINSISLQEALDKIKQAELRDSKFGFVTTSDEIKTFEIIKTIIAMTSKISNDDLSRISYVDKKSVFNIITDNKARNVICQLKYTDNKNLITIDEQEYLLKDITVKEITKHKKSIISSAIKLL